MYNSLPEKISSRNGFQGCLASLDLNGVRPNILDSAHRVYSSVVKGCEGKLSMTLTLSNSFNDLDLIAGFLFIDGMLIQIFLVKDLVNNSSIARWECLSEYINIEQCMLLYFVEWQIILWFSNVCDLLNISVVVMLWNWTKIKAHK